MELDTEVRRDFLQRLIRRFSPPIKAVEELIWNSLDGDATRVDVVLERNELDAVEAVSVADNGHGIAHELAAEAFKKLGDSWKSRAARTPSGRPLHGQKGEGRFSALAIGDRVKWVSHYKAAGQNHTLTIETSFGRAGRFHLSDPAPSDHLLPGTTARITEIAKHPKSLVADDAMTRLAETFALYLLQHDSVQIWHDGRRVDPASVQRNVKTYQIPPSNDDDPRDGAEVTVIEWAHKTGGREIVFCDASGCALHSRKILFHTPGFSNFSVYLKGQLVREKQASLDLDKLDPELMRLVDALKPIVKQHFRERAAEAAKGRVDEWIRDDVYPYVGRPSSVVERAERQVFDVVALNISEYLPDFEPSGPVAKRMTFQMLKAAIEQSPTTVKRLVQEVLDLPEDKREQLVELLDHVSLSAIVAASKVVLDRLMFLAGLRVVIFDYEAKQKTKERKHLQHLVAENPWIFGEEYHLAVDDQDLKQVLKQHLRILGREPEVEEPVLRLDGRRGIVDLMLSKKVRLPRADEYEHLVVELKRPTQKINRKVLDQIEDYANAVAKDERFAASNVRWVFWALSNDIADAADRRVNQTDRPPGLVFQKGNITIWAKTWAQVLDQADARMNFYRKQLEVMVTQEQGLAHLQQVYSDYLPELLQAERGADEAGTGASATPPANMPLAADTSQDTPAS